MSGIGLDVGTYNLVCCRRDDQGNFVQKREVNAFIEIPQETQFLFNMMKTAGVPLVERKDLHMAYALGESAVKIACDMPQTELHRPMKDGCLNPSERSAHQLLAIMIHSILDDIKVDNETLYYCVPANAINGNTNTEFHIKVLESIFRGFKDKDGKHVNANPINEGLALVYAELGHKHWSGMGLSFGAGMVNVCYAKFGNPLFAFSLDSGDWIDQMVATATNMPVAYVNREKEKTDLNVEVPDQFVQRVIKAEYEIMMQKTASGIKKGLEKVMGTMPLETVDIVIAGGSSIPPGFDNMFTEVLKKTQLPIPMGEIIRTKDPLYSVARGCLIAAEAADKG